MKSCWAWDVLFSNIALSYAKVTTVWWCYDSKYQHFLKPLSCLQLGFVQRQQVKTKSLQTWTQSWRYAALRILFDSALESKIVVQIWSRSQEVKTFPPIFNVFFCMICLGGVRWLDDLSQQMIGWRLRLVVLLFSESPFSQGISSPKRMCHDLCIKDSYGPGGERTSARATKKSCCYVMCVCVLRNEQGVRSFLMYGKTWWNRSAKRCLSFDYRLLQSTSWIFWSNFLSVTKPLGSSLLFNEVGVDHGRWSSTRENSSTS